MPDDSNASRDERPARENERWRERAERAERERDQAQREHDRVQRENDRRRQQIDHLKRQLEEARRAGFRQAAPFAKSLTPHPKRPGHGRAGVWSESASCSPPQADETYEAPVPAQCPDCGAW